MSTKISRPKIMLEIRLPKVETAADSRQSYNKLYGEAENISQAHSFYLWFIDMMGLRSDDVYLDISCGRAELVNLALAQGVQAYGLDLSYVAVWQGLQKRGSLVAGNGQTLPYADASFTVASNVGSLEHYVDMEAAVREMARVLKKNGRAYVLVPNTFSLMNNVWIAFRQGRTSIDDQPIQRYGARLEWQHLLEDNGLEVVQTRKYERIWPRNWPDMKARLRYPKEIVRLFLTPFIPLNLAFSFVFECRKR